MDNNGKISSYSANHHTWSANDEITAEQLNNIENGILDVTQAVVDAQSGDLSLARRLSRLETNQGVDYSEQLTSLDSKIDTLQSNYNTVNAALSNKANSADLTTLATAIGTIRSTVDTINTAVKDYNKAENEVFEAHTSLANGIEYDDINARFEAIETDINASSDLGNRVQALESEVGMGNASNSRIDQLESTVNNATTGLAATKAIADEAKSTADEAKSTANEAKNKADAAVTSTQLASALNDKADKTTTDGLATRIQTLENNPASTTRVIDNVTYDTTTGAPTNITDPSSNIDYLLKKDDQYYYWKYIGNTWHLISGGGEGGGGTSSASILSALPEISQGDANVDYFIGNINTGYTHYRFINNQYVKMLPNNLISSIGVNTVEINHETVSDSWPADDVSQVSGGLTAYALGDTEQTTNLLENFVAVRNARINATYEADGQTLKTQTLQVLDTNGNIAEYPIVGGSGGGSVYTVRIETTSPIARSIPSNSTDPVEIRAKVVMKQGNELVPGATAFGQIQYRVNGTNTWLTGDRIEVEASESSMRYTIQNDTYFTIDVTKYLEADKTMQIRLAIEAHPESSEESVMRYQIFTISKVNISIVAEAFDYASVKTSNFQFNYRCFGTNIAKTVHFLVDGEDIVTPVYVAANVTNTTVLQQVIPITQKENGTHTFQVYFTTNDGVESNKLNYFILYNTDSTRQAPLLGAAAENTNIVDGDEIIINYSVSTADLETTDKVEIELYTMNEGNKEVIQTSELTDVTNNTLRVWRTFNYPKVERVTADEIPDPKTVYVKLTATHVSDASGEPVEFSDTQTIEITINFLNTTYNLEPAGTNNLLYSYEAYGRSNNAANKEVYKYDYTTIGGQQVEFTGSFNGFNWATDGYADGQSLMIGGGATYSINVPIFSSTFNGVNIEENANVQDITQIGRTIEIDYEVQSATDLNAVIMNCMTNIQTTTENGITTTRANGFQVTPQSCYLLNSSAGIERDESGFILNEDSIAAAYLTPGQRIHLVFVIEPWATNEQRDNAFDGEYHQSTNIYVNGEFANACPYKRDKITGNLAGNSFSTDATITIGSDSCLIKLYSVKLYNRGLTHEQVLQNYKVAPVATRDKLSRLEENDILNNSGLVDYEKARTKYTCLLLTGPAPVDANNKVVPTISPFKGSPSPAGRRDKKTNEVVGKTESGLTLTKPSSTDAKGYTVEFDLQDTIPAGQAAYLGAVGSYCSSNNVQGTSSQKYPVHNLKIYLAKWQDAEEAVYETREVEDPETHEITTEQVLVKDAVSAGIAKVKYCLKGKDQEGENLGVAESTLCWKADYMSTDHANTFNANIADGLFDNRVDSGWKISDWDAKHYQNTVYGIRCLLFQKQGDNPPEFLGDGCLNNDKGNSKTYGLEDKQDTGNNTRSQKWEFTNNSEDLAYFKTDDLTSMLNGKIRAKNGFESTYPDEGDLEDEGLEPNYNHLQVLLTWVSKRANYWDETDPDARAAKKEIFRNEFTKHFNLNHVLTYYLFLEYTALCDNRVKNMFLRSDNVRDEIIIHGDDTEILKGNDAPTDLWSNYVDPSTGETNPDYINWTASTFAVWAPVLYDLDSCFGVENVGLIKIRYDADWHYQWKGTPQFNGENSIFWLMVEDTFGSELATLALTLYNSQPGLNYRTFNQQQIIENQAQISPALTNQDMLIKFDKPWSEGFINYAETPDSSGQYPRQTPEYKYLQRGSRAAQKSQFMQQRSMLLSSYYGASEYLNSSITFRTGVPVGASGNVIGYQDDDEDKPIYGNGDLTETQITLKANQILYPGVAYGDNKPPTRVLANDGKVEANTSCTIQATSAVQGNDGIFIYGASVLTDIGDISKFKPLQLNVSAGVNLKRLIIGSNASGYTNNTTNSITGLNRCQLLEEINVRNLKQMNILTLSSNGFIKEVYAAGSGINTISLPQGGVLETIEYGANTTDITIVNQGRLQNFTYENSDVNNYANVNRIWIENTPNIPVVDLVLKTWDHLNDGLRLVGINVDLNTYDNEEVTGADTTFIDYLVSDAAKGKYLSAAGIHQTNNQPPEVSGTIVINEIRQTLADKLHELYPHITLIASADHEINYIQDHKIYYQDYDGTLLLTLSAISGETIVDPIIATDVYGNTYLQEPTRASDVAASYSFGVHDTYGYVAYTGWERRAQNNNSYSPLSDNNIMGEYDTYIRAVYSSRPMEYKIVWKTADGSIIRERRGIQYNTALATSGIVHPAIGEKDLMLPNFYKYQAANGKYKLLTGWDTPLTGNLTGDMIITGIYEENQYTFDEGTVIDDLGKLNAADLYALSNATNSTITSAVGNQLNNTYFNIQMGNDIDYANVTSANLIAEVQATAQSLTYTGATNSYNVLNNYKLLQDNGAFTIAFDFTPNMTSSIWGSQEYVFASCYKTTSTPSISGFRLSLVNDGTIRVYWGDQSVVIDNYTTITSNNVVTGINAYRTIVVIAHDAGSSTLRVYYPDPASAVNMMSEKVAHTDLNFSSSITNDNPLILGGAYAANGNISATQLLRSGACTFNWIKYWNAALSNGDCLNLAAWPHKNIKCALVGYYNGIGITNTETMLLVSDNDVKLSFAMMEPVSDRYYFTSTMFSTNATRLSWDTSAVKTFCTNRLFKALPIKYQALIKPTTIVEYGRNRDLNNQTMTHSSMESYDNYLYLPAQGEYLTNDNLQNTNGYNTEITHALPWISALNGPVIYSLSSNGQLHIEDNILGITPYRWRFNGHVMTKDSRIFYFENNPCRALNYTIEGGQGETNIQVGDIWYRAVDQNTHVYIFISGEDIINGQHIDSDLIYKDNNNQIVGGWLEGIVWLSRSYKDQLNYANSGTNVAFINFTALGGINANTNTNTTNIYALCPEFSI